MSQNDFTIANQGFPAFRADLNSALQALASNSSGTSAPSTTFANMWWYDSANNIMYIRNEDNDAWIKFAELDQTNDKFVLSGTLQLDDGTVSAPALTFNSDTNMGIYRGGTDILKFVTAGVDAITIDASQNVAIGHTSTGGSNFAICDGANSAIQFFPEISTDTNLIQHYDQTATAYMNSEHRANSHIFKIGTSNAVKIDSSNNLLVGKTSTGFGTAGVELSQNGVAGKVFMTRSGGESLSLNRLSSDGEIVGFYKDSTLVGSIGTQGGTLEVGSGDVYLQFNGTNDWIKPVDGSGSNKPNVDLGTSGARFKDLYLSDGVNIKGSTPKITLEHSNENGTAQIYTTAQSAIILDADPDNTDNGTPIQFKIDGNEVGRFDSGGRFIAPYGVTLGTSAGTYSASNTLDDYEEGTFTPNYPNVTIGNGTTNGLFTKIGSLVMVQIHFIMGSTTSIGGSFFLDNLPFAATGTLLDHYGLTGNLLNSGTDNYIAYGRVQDATTNGFVYYPQSGSSGSPNASRNVNTTAPFTWAVNDKIECGFMYYTDA